MLGTAGQGKPHETLVEAVSKEEQCKQTLRAAPGKIAPACLGSVPWVCGGKAVKGISLASPSPSPGLCYSGSGAFVSSPCHCQVSYFIETSVGKVQFRADPYSGKGLPHLSRGECPRHAGLVIRPLAVLQW